MTTSTRSSMIAAPAWPLVATGTACGLAWAGALRGWMIQLAGPDHSHVTWAGTFGLQFAPGAVVGAAFGYAEYRRRTGGVRSRWLTLAPLAFLVALLMPWIFIALITSGLGSGAIGVTLFGLAGGYALSGHGRRWTRWSSGTFATLGVLLIAVMASDVVPLGSARGAWVAILASSLLALLCLACAIPQRIGIPTDVPAWASTAVGALAGLAWSAALRAFLSAVAAEDGTRFDSGGTFGFVLLPGAAIGAVLAWAEWRRHRGPVPHRRWVIWTPMLFAAVLLQHPTDLMEGFDGGAGLSAVAVPAICMVGGYGISGRGRTWWRASCLLVLIACIPAYAWAATAVGGPSMSLATPHGAWAAALFWSLLLTFSIAAGLPHRAPIASTVDPSDGVPDDAHPRRNNQDAALPVVNP